MKKHNQRIFDLFFVFDLFFEKADYRRNIGFSSEIDLILRQTMLTKKVLLKTLIFL